jgi:protein CsiD
VLGLEGVSQDSDDYVKFGTAIGHILGPANHDSMSNKYYARFLVKHTDASDSICARPIVCSPCTPTAPS